jgi:hypothetical protein
MFHLLLGIKKLYENFKECRGDVLFLMRNIAVCAIGDQKEKASKYYSEV